MSTGETFTQLIKRKMSKTKKSHEHDLLDESQHLMGREKEGFQWFKYVIFPISGFTVFSIATTGLVIALILYLKKFTDFNALTNYGVIPSSAITTINGENEYVIPCTNSSIGNETIVFTGDTFFGVPCGETGDICSINFCTTEAICERRVADNYTCFDDSQCTDGQICNKTTCECELRYASSICQTVADCQLVQGNDCLETACVNGTCLTGLVAGAECSSVTGCSSGLTCNSTCMCEVETATTVCLLDSDCQPVQGNDCLETACVNGTCLTDLIAGAECSSTTGCSSGLSCNQTCMCDTISVVSVCMVDGDCQQVNLPCAESRCNTTTNQCYIDLLPGAECFVGTQCNSGFACNSTCMCDLITEAAGCTVDGDCQGFTANPCIEAKCVANTCVTQLTAGATCSSTTGCSSGQSCNSTCMCEPTVAASGCTLDEQCQADNTNPCVEAVCNGGVCETNLIAGASCSSTTQCTGGNICNSTCLCEAPTQETTFLDTEFTLQDETNPLSLAQFSTVSGNDGTITYQLPNLIDPILTGTFTATTGTATPSTFPWSSAFGTTYKIVFVGSGNGNNVVTLTIDSNIHTGGNGTNPIIYNALIPAAYRPLTVPFVANVVSGEVSATYTSVEMSVRSSGNLEFFTTGHAGFPNVASNQGHQACSITWTT